ncbi:MAG: protein-glutamate O-methyltransferase [Tepidisphaeraceae bacterium]
MPHSAIANTIEPQISRADFDRLSKAVYDYCKINLTDQKVDLARARLAKRLRTTGLTTYTEYLDRYLNDRDSDEFVELIDALSTNLTSFFRENQHFDYLQQTLLPDIVRRSGGTKRIRAWSAACSSGEEPYTISLVLSETLEKLNARQGWDVKLLATDISTRVLRKAVAGAYELERVKTVPPALRGKYFEPRRIGGDDHLLVKPELRNLIVFNRLNLMETWPFTGPFDFIFCRNVMIYFDKATQERLVNRFYDVLAPGGVLFTGHSESLTGVNHKFKFVQATIYQKS